MCFHIISPHRTGLAALQGKELHLSRLHHLNSASVPRGMLQAFHVVAARADLLWWGTNFKYFMDGFSETMEVVLYQTFPLKALFSEDADESEELCDLFQIKHCSVVELDDSQRLLVIGTTTAILH